MNEFVQKFEVVQFYDDQIEGVYEDGKVWVPLRRLCECLGVSTQGQLEKLKNKKNYPWASIKTIFMDDARGCNREVCVVDTRTMTMWLATIDGARVAEAVRPKLHRYQIECADRLHEHFMKPREQDPIIAAGQQMAVVGQQIVELRRAQIEEERKQKEATQASLCALQMAVEALQ
jgi:hypothetical protein